MVSFSLIFSKESFISAIKRFSWMMSVNSVSATNATCPVPKEP